MSRFKELTLLLLILVLASSCSKESSVVDIKNKILPDSNSAGAKLLQSYCSECHGAPSPTDHIAAHWPNVVERMQTHRIRTAYEAVPEKDKQIIISYLQKYAKQ